MRLVFLRVNFVKFLEKSVNFGTRKNHSLIRFRSYWATAADNIINCFVITKVTIRRTNIGTLLSSANPTICILFYAIIWRSSLLVKVLPLVVTPGGGIPNW